MDIYEAFETSSQLVTEGRWIDLEFGGAVVCSFKVRSASPDLNADLRKAMAAEAVASMQTVSGLEDAVQDAKLENRLFAQSVVADWKGVTNGDGKALKCTPKNIEKVFTELPLLAQRVKREAYKWTNFRTVHEEEALGNSSKS
ncbi:MAG: hypothetical protein KAI80_10170 [Hyphomicrobiaceae bacterium]|nr:hypothetical protein [Hyphomicrobiaceae bacterium]